MLLFINTQIKDCRGSSSSATCGNYSNYGDYKKESNDKQINDSSEL